MGNEYNYSRPIEIAKDIFWVGSVIHGDPFQCHSYLILNNNESVLIDPGSIITFEVTVRKIKEITDIENIKYLICHHQDPDIVSCISYIENLINRDDKFIVTHWRTQALLKHYNWKTTFWLINEHNWELNLNNNRKLKFIFTPYAHFAGAFCTFDEKTKTLFSSDIFGGFTENFSLFAKDKTYFDSIRLFHEHYMPSQEILNNALTEIERVNPDLIAPQHGSIIKKDLISPIIKMLKSLDCGLFKFGGDSNIKRLSRINMVLKGILDDLALDVRLNDALRHIKKLISELIDLEELLIIASTDREDSRLVIFLTDPLYSSPIILTKNKKEFGQAMDILNNMEDIYPQDFINISFLNYSNKKAMVFPLRSKERRTMGVGVILLKDNANLMDTSYLNIFDRVSALLSVALERELNLLSAEEEKERFYKMAITDPLTGLYNRIYLNTVVDEEFYKAKRYNYPLSVAIFDIDHFKKVNDKYGHLVGDFVLKEIGNIVKKSIRKGDIPIRYGGEEILVVLPFSKKNDGYIVAERIRQEVEKTDFKIFGVTLKITISAGVASLENENSLIELIKKADNNLYMAKSRGRNRVV